MLKFKKLTTTLLCVTLLSSSAYINVMAETENTPVVYSYIDDNNNTVNITQSDLDAGHWNKNALGETAPFIYEEFPMSVTGYVNDFAEVSLDIIYMKNLSDMQSVNLKLTDMETGTVVYNDNLTKYSFYSPVIPCGTYELKLTETVDDETTEYVRILVVDKTEAQMPEYVTNPTADDDSRILISDIETLRASQTVNAEGQIVINSTAPRYNRVAASEFNTYCNTLSEDAIYRIYTNSDNVQYAGFLSIDNGVKDIFTYQVSTYTTDAFYAPSIASYPSSGIDDLDVANEAMPLGFTDRSFRLRERSDSSKYVVYVVNVPTRYLGEDSEEDEPTITNAIFRVNITGTSRIAMRVYRESNNTFGPSWFRTLTSSNNLNNKSFDIRIDDEDTNVDYLSFYFVVYFPDEVDGYGMISLESVSGYDDDVTGSIYNAFMGDSAYYELPNTEFSTTDIYDVDAFCIDYWGTNNAVYKITLKNRSLAEQTELDNGNWVDNAGSPPKYLSTWVVEEAGTLYDWSQFSTYLIPKNTDMVIYCNPADYDEHVITVENERGGLNESYNYQLSFIKMN